MNDREMRILAGVRRGTEPEVRVVDKAKRQFVARVLTYGTVDDYGTRWVPGCFAESLKVRMPRVAWAHSWSEPIGHYTEVVRDDNTALELLGQLDDFDAVPRARQAYAQMQSGTIDQFSVGFTRQKWTHVEDDPDGAREEMVTALLDEASPVLVGAVPGTSLLSVRSAGQVDLDKVVRLAKDVTAGTLTHAEAEAALSLLAGPPAAGLSVPETVVEVPTDDLGALLAEADAVLGRSRRR